MKARSDASCMLPAPPIPLEKGPLTRGTVDIDDRGVVEQAAPTLR